MYSWYVRCAGYAKRYRYCEYFGKYFCPCCHSNDRTYIPGHILCNWNFTKFPVSHFALDLLKRIFDDPLFSIEASSSSILLYKKVPVLDEVCSCRTQLVHLSAFVNTCTRPGRYAVLHSHIMSFKYSWHIYYCVIFLLCQHSFQYLVNYCNYGIYFSWMLIANSHRHYNNNNNSSFV